MVRQQCPAFAAAPDAAGLEEIAAVGEFECLEGGFVRREDGHAVVIKLFDDLENLFDDDRNQSYMYMVPRSQVY